MWTDRRYFRGDDLEADLDEETIEEFLNDNAASFISCAMVNDWYSVVGYLADHEEDLKYWLRISADYEEDHHDDL